MLSFGVALHLYVYKQEGMRDSQNPREVALTVMVSLKMKNICYWNVRSMRIYDELYSKQCMTR